MTRLEHAESTLQASTLRPDLLNSIRVTKNGEVRVVECFCGEQVKRSIVPHMKKSHEKEWTNWLGIFLELRRQGLSLKKIMRLFQSGNGPLLFSWTVIERAIRSSVEAGEALYTPPPISSVKTWEPVDFKMEKTTIWNFPIRGSWAVHAGDYRGNWPPQLVRNIITKFTRPGDLVLDPFVGGGTTLIEAWLLGRYSVGIDISKLAFQSASARLEHMQLLSEQDNRARLEYKYKPQLILGDSTFVDENTSYKTIRPHSVNLLCVHPPYLDALAFTEGHSKDLSSVREPGEFLRRITVFAKASTAYLAPDNFCAVLIGDVRRNGRITPLGAWTLDALLDVGFQLREVIVKTQNRDRSSEFYYSAAHGYLLAHEYLYILQWPLEESPAQC